MNPSDQIKQLLDLFKTQQQYSDEEMARIAENPKFMQVLSRAPQLLATRFSFEIEEAHGCVVQHQSGQVICINGDGSLDSQAGPAKTCIYLLHALTPLVCAAQEFIYAGLDPNNLKFTKIGCFDVGAKCGGFGHVSMRFRAQSA